MENQTKKFISLKLFSIILFLLLIPGDFGTNDFNILPEESTLLYLKDYDKNGYFITTKRLFFSKNINYSEPFETEFPTNAVFTTYPNSSYILTGCTNNLLGYININTLTETQITNYGYISASSTSNICSLSFIDKYAYIVITNIEDNIIKLKYGRLQLALRNDEIVIDNSPGYFSSEIYKKTSSDFNYLSCDVITDSGFYSVICGYVDFDESANKYLYIASPTKSGLNGFDGNFTVFESEKLLNFIVERINSSYIRYLVGEESFELYMVYEGSYFKIFKVSENKKNIFRFILL